MSALLVVIGLLLGTAAPASLGAITALQWAELGITVAGDARDMIKLQQQLAVMVNSPAFRAWAAANGDAAIRLQPGISTTR